MSRSNRGAARVSVIWIIVTGVLALATTAFAFITQGDLTRANKNLAAAQASEKQAVDGFQEVNTRRQQVVEVLGHFDPSSADPVADLDEAKEAIAEYRATWPDISATVTNYQGIMPVVKAAFNRQADTIASQKAEIERLNSELSSRADALAAVTSDKESKIQDLNRQLADLQQNADARQQSLQSTIDDTRAEVADTDQRLRDSEAEFTAKQTDLMKKVELKEAQNGSLMNDLKLRLEADRKLSDGKILAVDDGNGKAWINRGSDNRLTTGTVFDIYGEQNGELVHKGIGKVSKIVGGTMAELNLRTKDRTDPVVIGDRIVNPFYDPSQERKAVLIGEFAGRDELVAALSRMNIVVEKNLSIETRLAIVGGPLRVDPETGEDLEEERQAQDLDIYKQAEARNIQLMTVSMLRQYFPQSL